VRQRVRSFPFLGQSDLSFNGKLKFLSGNRFIRLNDSPAVTALRRFEYTAGRYEPVMVWQIVGEKPHRILVPGPAMQQKHDSLAVNGNGIRWLFYAQEPPIKIEVSGVNPGWHGGRSNPLSRK